MSSVAASASVAATIATVMSNETKCHASIGTACSARGGFARWRANDLNDYENRKGEKQNGDDRNVLQSRCSLSWAVKEKP
ncbi:hypothetical protein N6L27_11230 [Leisingera sp. SS27]|uniref:hypothetical protein n=1 Tax=Leisingera sp. SS27 TaxID=2979462 RepID=UPI00232DDB77|nr:hypothetical protein [Leisingera sp. SS27]MDC0658571.1 hypothetical protein [Leisingera sp. SS27]